MGRKALIFIILMGLAGCQSVEKRATKAAQANGQTAASVDFPPLPEACTTHVERMKPKVGESAGLISDGK